MKTTVLHNVANTFFLRESGGTVNELFYLLASHRFARCFSSGTLTDGVFIFRSSPIPLPAGAGWHKGNVTVGTRADGPQSQP